MTDRKKVLLLSVLIMTFVALAVAGISLRGLYHAAFEQQRERLVETVRSRARLIEAIAHFDAIYSATEFPGGAEAATLSKVIRAHEQFRGFGETGEFTLARRAADKIIFLLSHRHFDLDNPRPVPFDSEWAEPMHRALSGESGTVIGLDYRGEMVLAAYEQIDVLNWGVVGKIDLAEIRGVFIRAGLAVAAVGVLVILAGAALFLRSTDPLIKRLETNEARTRSILDAAADGVITIDEQGTIESFNKAAERIFGFAASEVIGKNATVLMPEPYSKHHDEYIARYLRTGRGKVIGSTQEVEGRRRDGTTFPLEASVSEVALPGRRLFTGVFRDITQRKRAEQELRKSESRLQEAQRIARMGSWDWNIVTNDLHWSDEIYRIFGLSRGEFGVTYDAFLASVHPADREFVQRHVNAALEDDVAYSIDHRIVLPSGEVHHIHEQGEVSRDADGTPVRMVGTAIDITERKRAEEAAREHARLLEAFFQHSLMAIVFLDRDFNFIRVNEAYARGCQRDVSDFPGHNHFELYPSDAQEIFEEVRESKKPCKVIGRPFIFPDHPEWGVTYWDWTLVPILDDRGEVELLVFCLSDVTERKRAEEAHRLDEARLEALVKLNEMTEAPFQEVADFALDEAVKVTQSEMGFLGFMNDDESVQTIHAWSGRAMQQCAIVDKPTEFIIAEAGLWGEVIRQRKSIVVNDYADLETFKKGYPEGHVDISRFLAIPVFDGERIVAVAAAANKENEYQEGDVRQLSLLMNGMWRLIQRQRAREALQRSEERFRAIADYTYDWENWVGPDGQLRWINPAVERITGYTAEECLAMPAYPLPLIHEDDRVAMAGIFECAILKQTSGSDVSFRFYRKDDTIRWGAVSWQPIFDSDNLCLGLRSSIRDVTDRKRAEEALRESRSFLQTIIDEIPELLMVLDRDFRIVLANRPVRELSGGQDPVARCLTCHQASQNRDGPCKEEERPCPLRQVLRTKAPVVATHGHLDSDGNELLMEMFAAPVFDEAGEVVQVIEVCRDVTARVRAEEEAQQRQAELAHVARLGTMGEMATGLAHELNQPLAAIINYTQACLERLRSGAGDPEELLDDMKQAGAQAERAGEIIDHIRHFVRKGTPRRTAADINALVREAAELVGYEARRSGVQIRLKLLDALPAVAAEAIQIEQVIVNLMRNGFEAMQKTKTGTRRLTVQTMGPADRSIEVAIHDTGPGVCGDAAEGMFNPFFTTKSEGMGMGLSISRTIIEAHGGRLWASSNPDQGATFRFTLPAASSGGSHHDA